MSNDKAIDIAKLPYKSREAYKSQLKEQLMEAIGTAQAVMLLQKTPKGEIRKRLMNPQKPAGANNPEFSYVEHAYVSEQLDLTFFMDWDLIVTKSERVGEEALVEGYLECRFKNKTIIKKHGFGGAVHRNNPNMTWGDTFKSATSDLLKNCAARMGIARDLYRHEEKVTDKFIEIKSEPKGEAPQLEDGSRPATEAQLQTIKSLDPEFDVATSNFTKQEAVNRLDELRKELIKK